MKDGQSADLGDQPESDDCRGLRPRSRNIPAELDAIRDEEEASFIAASGEPGEKSIYVYPPSH